MSVYSCSELQECHAVRKRGPIKHSTGPHRTALDRPKLEAGVLPLMGAYQ